MINLTTVRNVAILVGLLACALSACTGSCLVKSRTPLSYRASQERNANPSETPIPLQPTKENNGKRCEAKYYFGVGRSGNDEGYTPFCHELQLKLAKAAKEGDLAQIRDALRYGASVDLPVDDYDPSLQIAAAYGQTGAVRLLLDNEASVNKGTFIRGTPLIAAAGNGHEEVVKILLQSGADVCVKADGGTAKEFAEQQGHKEIVELLNAAKQADCK